MSTSPPTPSMPRKPFNFARLITIFAVVFGITFGLCTVNFMMGGSKGGLNGLYVIVSIEVICLVGILITAVVAVVRSYRK